MAIDTDAARRTARTVFQAVVALAAAAPLIYSAVFSSSPEQASGGLLVALGVAGAITRVMALPGVETFLQTYVPWLAAGEAEPAYVARRALVEGEPESEPIPGTDIDTDDVVELEDH